MNLIEHDRFSESLLILFLINKEISIYGELFEDADKILTAENSECNFNRYHAFYSLILIKVVSFFDEYDLLRSISTDRIEFRTIDKKIIPYRKRLEKWKDIKKLRNTFLAHNYRDTKKNNVLVLLNDYISTFNVPITTYDVRLVVKIIDVILETLGSFFGEELTLALIGYSSTVHHNDTIKSEMHLKALKTEDEYNIEIEKLEKF